MVRTVYIHKQQLQQHKSEFVYSMNNKQAISLNHVAFNATAACVADIIFATRSVSTRAAGGDTMETRVVGEGHTVTALQCGTLYHFFVTARNVIGGCWRIGVHSASEVIGGCWRIGVHSASEVNGGCWRIGVHSASEVIGGCWRIDVHSASEVIGGC